MDFDLYMNIFLTNRNSLALQDIQPDVVTYTTLMKALIRVEKFEKVLIFLYFFLFIFNF